MHLTLALSVFLSLRPVASHIAIWHPSMWGFNVTEQTMSYDNRPVVPLYNRTFKKWWFHDHLDYPPHPEDVFELPAGGNATHQLACNKGATTYYASSEGGNIQDPNNLDTPCPNSSSAAWHTTNYTDTGGCALSIAYKDNITDVQPEDLVVFSIVHGCVWTRYTDFAVPARMPPCKNDLCICAFHWHHRPDNGSEQMYMNGFQCKVTNSTSNVGLASPKVARRCGTDPYYPGVVAVPGNCTYGAKQPYYWLQAERNNMFEGYYDLPTYKDFYNFRDGAQDDIFNDSYSYMPVPGPTQTLLPLPTPSWLLPSASTSTSVKGASGAATPDALGGAVLFASSTPTTSNSAAQLASPTPAVPYNAAQLDSSTPTTSTDAASPPSTPSASGSQCGVQARSAGALPRRHAEQAKARLSSREDWEI